MPKQIPEHIVIVVILGPQINFVFRNQSNVRLPVVFYFNLILNFVGPLVLSRPR